MNTTIMNTTNSVTTAKNTLYFQNKRKHWYTDDILMMFIHFFLGDFLLIVNNKYWTLFMLMGFFYSALSLFNYYTQNAHKFKQGDD